MDLIDTFPPRAKYLHFFSQLRQTFQYCCSGNMIYQTPYLVFGLLYFAVHLVHAISGGTNVTDGEAPYTVAINSLDWLGWTYTCGGVLIGTRSVITAAQCVDGKTTSQLSIRIGDTNRIAAPITGLVSQILIHPNFDPISFQADIAVLTLNDAPSNIPSVSLEDVSTTEGSQVTLFGWGKIHLLDLISPTQLQQTNVSVVTAANCARKDGLVHPGQFCDQSTAGNRGACTGDQGGPVINSNGRLVGIISSPENCGLASLEVNTDTVYYRSWILSKVQ